jgi:hypothetical protein
MKVDQFRQVKNGKEEIGFGYYLFFTKRQLKILKIDSENI